MRFTRPRATKLSQLSIDTDLVLGAHKLKTTNVAFWERSANELHLRNLANDAYRTLLANPLYAVGQLIVDGAPGYIDNANADGRITSLRARDTGVDRAVVAQAVGAAVAYFDLKAGRARLDGVDLRSLIIIWGLIG